MSKIIWTPQPRQLEFMSRMEDEALYGGAAGGGKSDCALAEALRQVHIPYYRGLILRKTYPQLTELMDRSMEIYHPAYPGAKYNDSKHAWTFPSGAKIYFGSMQHTRDRTNYQGKRYDYIDFDELTQFQYDEYSYMFSRNRPNGPDTRCYIRGQANPGGVGHGWVKERFITAGKPGKTIWEKVNIRWPDGHIETRWKSRIFVPSSVFDNKILLENDPEYITRLASMPEAERNALLYGDWDSFAGQAFTEWRNDPDHYGDRVNTHVINPFKVPKEWRIWCGMDWGFTRPFAVGWYAVDHDKRIYRIKEFYGIATDKNGNVTPNVGVKMPVEAVAEKIKEIERTDPNLKGRQIFHVGDPAIWGTQGPESIGATFDRCLIHWEKADHDRIGGLMQMHNRFAFDENGIPMFYVFNTCKHFIRTIPTLVYDEKNVEDINTEQEDHIYDECRYVCMETMISPPPKDVPQLITFDPLDTAGPQKYDRYAFFRR